MSWMAEGSSKGGKRNGWEGRWLEMRNQKGGSDLLWSSVELPPG